jgi:hypothetical protein
MKQGLVRLGQRLLEVLDLLCFLVWQHASDDIGGGDADLCTYCVGGDLVVAR